MADGMTELTEVTLAVLAVVEGTNRAEQRRRALAERAEQALRDPSIAVAVEAILAARRARRGGDNVVPMQRRGRRAR
jgi:hypothetical protein